MCTECQSKQEEIDSLIAQQDIDAAAIRELEMTNDALTADNARLREQLRLFKDIGNDLSIIAVNQQERMRKQKVS